MRAVRHADAIADPRGGTVAGATVFARDQVDEPSAVAGFVVEPHAGLRAGDDHGQTALAAPAPFPPGAKTGLAQKLDAKLWHPRAQLGVEGLPVPPAHCRHRGTRPRPPVGPKAAAAVRRGLRRQADTGVGNRNVGCVAPGSAALQAALATLEPVRPAACCLSEKGGPLPASH